MAREEFPRFRKKDFVYQGVMELPFYRGGRLDLECAQRFDMPSVYKVFAAANRITNPMVTRPGIRPMDESIRNELVLRGYSGAQLDAELRRVKDECVSGNRDWLGYSDFGNGNITDADPGRMLFSPSPESAVKWYERYNELNEVTVESEV